MRSYRTTCHVLATLILSSASGLTVFAGDGPAKKAEPLPPEMIAAWKNAGADFAWETKEGRFDRSAKGKSGAVPAINFLFGKVEMLATLPDPGVPFALSLYSITTTDDDLKNAARFKSLQSLTLGGLRGPLDPIDKTKITDAGLTHLSGLNKLQSLNLHQTRVTDAGLKELAGRKFRKLDIPYAAQTDLGLKNYLAAAEVSTSLDLTGWKVTNAGLKELARVAGLKELILNYTEVTDAGLKELAGLKGLQLLNLGSTQVTATGVAALQKELPKCRIFH